MTQVHNIQVDVLAPAPMPEKYFCVLYFTHVNGMLPVIAPRSMNLVGVVIQCLNFQNVLLASATTKCIYLAHENAHCEFQSGPILVQSPPSYVTSEDLCSPTMNDQLLHRCVFCFLSLSLTSVFDQVAPANYQ